jgi:homotetrameric cytidine deaminase
VDPLVTPTLEKLASLCGISEGGLRELYRRAQENRDKAYSRYSGFPVGAAVLTRSGRIFGGCCVENGSFGLTICAERAALSAAVLGGVANDPHERIEAIVVTGPENVPCAPCGACRQWIAELAPRAVTVFRAEDGLTALPAEELLPHAFTVSLQRLGERDECGES